MERAAQAREVVARRPEPRHCEEGSMLPWEHSRYIKAIAEARSLSGSAQVPGVDGSTGFRRLPTVERTMEGAPNTERTRPEAQTITRLHKPPSIKEVQYVEPVER